jgi:hypothetical protein
MFFRRQPVGTTLDLCKAMSPGEARLVRHLAFAIAAKLAVLVALWWAFVRDDRVDVDVDQAAAHIGASATPTGEQP